MDDAGAVVLDGDDTLWLVEQLYDQARSEAAEIVASAGFDAARWIVLEQEIDLRNVGRVGLSAGRFPSSCVEAYLTMASDRGEDPDSEIVEKVRSAAEQVFQRKAPLVDGADEVVRYLRERYPVILLTKGETWVQERRIAESGLSFSATFIVPSKGKAEFAEILQGVGRSPLNSWSVGNSLPSDIAPALELGMRAIWIEAHVWEHERRGSRPADVRLVVADSLKEVPALIAEVSRFVSRRSAIAG